MIREYLVAYAIVIGILGAAVLSIGLYTWRRNRLFEDIPLSKIGDLPMGLVSIRGIAKPGDNLLEALSGKECVFYLWAHKSDKSISYYSPFYVEDSTGKILVDPTGVNYVKDDFYPDFQSSGTAIKEWIVRPGDRVSVIGTANIRNSYINDLKVKLNDELKKIKENPADLAKIDSNGNGKIENEEWDQKVSDLKKEVLEQLLQSNKHEDPQDRVVIGKGPEESTFLMSKCSYFDYLPIPPVPLLYIGSILMTISLLLAYYCRIH